MRRPDRYRSAAPARARNIVAACERRVLGRAIAVDDAAAWKRGERPRDMGWRKDIAARDQLAQRPQTVELLIHKKVKESGREPRSCDIMTAYRVDDFLKRRAAAADDCQPRPMEESPPQFQRACIEGRWGGVQECLVWTEGKKRLIEDKPNHSPMRNNNAFGPPGRTRRVHHVSRVSGFGSTLKRLVALRAPLPQTPHQSS